MEQYNSIQQILKKENGHDRKPIYPSTVIQAVFDAKTGASLEAILAQFNSIYVQYQGSPQATRNIIPVEMRRAGLMITYMNMDSETITEKASSAVQKDNDHWGLDVNWSRVDELSLSGDIAVSANGTWIINGVDTKVPARGSKGDAGLTPWLKTIDNKLHYSYDNTTWEPCSDYLAGYFRFNATSSDSQSGTIGKIQISKDNKTWQDLSPEFRNYLRIQGYVASTSELPKNQVVGTIYGVNEGTNTYSLHVWDGSSWVNNGTFTSIAAGVVQETGSSETEVMSQKAVTEKLSELGSKISGSNVTNQYKLTSGFYELNTALKAIQTSERCLGYILSFYDGKQWRKLKFIGDNTTDAYWNRDKYWVDCSNTTIDRKILFKDDNEISMNGLVNPFIDIVVVSNSGNDKLFVNACYRTESTILIQFINEDNKVVCQYYNRNFDSSKNGIQWIECEPYDSDVKIDVLLNIDFMSNFQDTLINPLEIRQKTTNLHYLDYSVFKDESKFSINSLFPIKETKVKINIDPNSYETRIMCKLPKLYETNRLKVDKSIGDSTTYSIFASVDSSLSNLELLKGDCIFSEWYDVVLPDGFNYIYIYSGSKNPSGFEGEVIITNGDAISLSVEKLKKEIKEVSKDRTSAIGGKTIVCFGDSITEFKDSFGKSYSEYLSEKTAANVINVGIGGTRISERKVPSLNIEYDVDAYAALDMCNLVKFWIDGDWEIADAANDYLTSNYSDNNSIQLSNLKGINVKNVDIITIFSGTNDFTGGTEFGIVGEVNHKTVLGALNSIIIDLLTANPNLRIYVFTPIIRWFNNIRDESNWCDNYKRADGETLSNMVDLIEISTKEKHIPCCNWYHSLGWNQYNFANYFNENDGTHPYKGFEYIAQKMASYILSNY